MAIPAPRRAWRDLGKIDRFALPLSTRICHVLVASQICPRNPRCCRTRVILFQVCFDRSDCSSRLRALGANISRRQIFRETMAGNLRFYKPWQRGSMPSPCVFPIFLASRRSPSSETNDFTSICFALLQGSPGSTYDITMLPATLRHLRISKDFLFSTCRFLHTCGSRPVPINLTALPETVRNRCGTDSPTAAC